MISDDYFRSNSGIRHRGIIGGPDLRLEYEIRSDILDVAFSGCDPISSGGSFLSEVLLNAWVLARRQNEMRTEFAISGAMRWPWSQEARMSSRSPIFDMD